MPQLFISRYENCYQYRDKVIDQEEKFTHSVLHKGGYSAGL